MLGGTGNTMLDYAFAMMLQERYPKVPVYMDISSFESENCGLQNPVSVYKNLFNISFQIADRETILIARKQGYIQQRESSIFREEDLMSGQGYFWGYWYSGKYFNDVKNKLRKAFTFNEEAMSFRQKRFLDKIRNTESVAVWIRRGDFLLEINAVSVGNICTERYYERAISYIKEKVKNAEFFVFSNDSEYIAEKYQDYNLMLYEENTSEIKDFDMYLMASCKHLIIANSSFSWWAAWLHGDNGIVIAPEKWRHEQESPDVWEDSWIRMQI